MYNINRVGENVTSVEEYDVTLSGETVTGKTLNGTMHYSFDSDGKQFRKKYVPAEGSEQKYVYEFRDEQNVAVELPTKAVSHTKNDHLGRKVFDELQLGKGTMNRKFSYYAGEITAAHEQNDKRKSDPETTLVKEIVFDNGRTIQYEYDNEERITKVIDSVDGTYEYTYDAQGQLLTEKKNGVTVNTMEYDHYGNIKKKNGKVYVYDSTWKDMLSSYDGQNIAYDDGGNPDIYFGVTLTWDKGRQLKTYGSNISYRYNNDGIRIEKRENGNIHTYTLDGTNIVKEVVTDTANCPKYTNEYLYDIDGTVCGLKYNETAYYFYKNLQGDVIAIADDTGAVKATYTYDAWGVCTVASDTSGCNIATINPFRYRGYYYDTETDLYYLQSRYYDPEVGRFINIDSIDVIKGDISLVAPNLYIYCKNNPVKNKDATGNFIAAKLAEIILNAISGVLLQLFTDLALYLCRKYLGGKNEEFNPDPIDYVTAAIDWALDCINPFSKKKKAKLIYDIIYPAIGVIIDYVWDFIKGKDINWGKFGYSLVKSMISGLINIALDKKTKKEIDELKRSFRRRLKPTPKNMKFAIKAEYKALGKKIKMSINISTTIIELVYDIFFGK